MSSCLIIETSEGKVIVQVSNLSKEAKLDAIGKTLGVGQDKIQEIIANQNQGIYALVNLVPKAVKMGCVIDEEYHSVFIVNFSKM